MPAIEARALVKTFPGDVQAVKGVDLAVDAGRIFGFLGPNGAGKSTMVRMLTTLLKPTSGTGRVAGFDVAHEPHKVRPAIGVALQDAGLDDLQTGRELIELQARLYGMPAADSAERARELLELMGLSDAADRRVGTYSGGMKRRLDLAAALVHRPGILFLDEPTTGLDPASRLAIWDYITGLNRDSEVTVFLTTQYLEEADRLCDEIAIIDFGEIVAQGSPAELKASIGADVLNLAFDGSIDLTGGDSRELRDRARALLEGFDDIHEVRETREGLTVFAENGASALPVILRRLSDNGIEPASITLAGPSLDDVFLTKTGHRLEGATGDAPGTDSPADGPRRGRSHMRGRNSPREKSGRRTRTPPPGEEGGGGMNLLRASAQLSKRAIREIPRVPAALYPNLFIPIFFYVVNIGAFSRIADVPQFFPPGTSYKGFQLPVPLLMSIAGAASASGLAMVTDIDLGYFDKLMLAPVNRFSIIIGRLMADFVRVAAQATLVLAFGLLIGAPLKAGPLGFVLIVLFAATWGLAYAGIGLTIALKTGNTQATQSSFVIFFPLIFLSTAFVPKQMLAGWLATAATYNPVTYMLQAMRSLILEGWRWGDLAKGFAAIAVLGALTLASAFAAMRSRVK